MNYYIPFAFLFYTLIIPRLFCYKIREQDGLDNINLFSLMTIISFALLVPTAILTEGVRFTPAYLQQYTVRLLIS